MLHRPCTYRGILQTLHTQWTTELHLQKHIPNQTACTQRLQKTHKTQIQPRTRKTLTPGKNNGNCQRYPKACNIYKKIQSYGQAKAGLRGPVGHIGKGEWCWLRRHLAFFIFFSFYHTPWYTPPKTPPSGLDHPTTPPVQLSPVKCKKIPHVT